MKVLLFVLLAGYAVRCDDNNYYVVDMGPDLRSSPSHRTLEVYWNVPTKQCRSKGIHFDDLHQRFGILQNENDAFQGDKVAILYDPGLFPALLKNESSGKFKFRNGGVPQEGDLAKHLEAFRDELDRSIPDQNFRGVGIIDFESWRPVFRQNFGVLVPYKDVSIEIERSRHRFWPQKWIEEEAKQRFESSARTFMESTLKLARQLRPAARWGYYGFPYCFNIASNNMQEDCAKGVPEENDRISWLWRASSALFPSVYSPAQLAGAQLAALLRGRAREAARFGSHVLPYFWYKYRDATQFFTQEDLNTVLTTFYKTKVAGFIVWGSSNDVNTVQKCINLRNYVYNIFGPAVAKYTKLGTKIRIDEQNTTIPDIDASSTTIDGTSGTDNIVKLQDPEYHWTPPENYTQDIKKHVAEEIATKLTNYSKTDEINSVLDNNVLIDLILNSIYNLNSVENSTENNVDSVILKEDNVNDTLNDTSSGTTTERSKDIDETTNLDIGHAELGNSPATENSDLLKTTNNDQTSLSINDNESLDFRSNEKDFKKMVIQNISIYDNSNEVVKATDAVSTESFYYEETTQKDYMAEFSDYDYTTYTPFTRILKQDKLSTSDIVTTTIDNIELNNLHSTTRNIDDFNESTTNSFISSINGENYFTMSTEIINKISDSITETSKTEKSIDTTRDYATIGLDNRTTKSQTTEGTTTADNINLQNSAETTSYSPESITKIETNLTSNTENSTSSTTEYISNITEGITNGDVSLNNKTTINSTASTETPYFKITEVITTVEDSEPTSTNQVVVFV